jgi:hypothetical protein
VSLAIGIPCVDFRRNFTPFFSFCGNDFIDGLNSLLQGSAVEFYRGVFLKNFAKKEDFVLCGICKVFHTHFLRYYGSGII